MSSFDPSEPPQNQHDFSFLLEDSLSTKHNSTSYLSRNYDEVSPSQLALNAPSRSTILQIQRQVRMWNNLDQTNSTNIT